MGILNIALRELVPLPVASAWVVSSPGERDIPIPLHPGYRIKDALSELDLSDLELSGAFGPNWISVEKGSASCAPCNGTHLFSWHYHPDGDIRLSVDDWITFLMSNAHITLLMTASHVSLYTKLQRGRWTNIRSSVAGPNPAATNMPNLWFVRFMKLMRKEMKTENWFECDENQIAAALGILHQGAWLE